MAGIVNLMPQRHLFYMATFASIRNRPTWIRGWPHSGWGITSQTAPGAKSLLFNFDISDDRGTGFVLVQYSVDGVFGADSWHQSLDEAFELATELGVDPSEWGPPIEAMPH
jgi:hypothetical protein